MERCTQRSEELELYCRLFDGENELFTEDEILKEFKRKIRRLYNFVTDSGTMNIEVEALTMLTTGKFAVRKKMHLRNSFQTLNFSF